MTDAINEPRNPRLENLLDLVLERVLDRIRGHEIGQVTSYDADEQSVSVQPVVGRRRSIQGVVTPYLTAVINHVPVWFPGGGGVRDTWPLVPGDYGVILFCSVSNARWKQTGGRVVDPGDDRRHHEGDALFIPGMHPLSAPPTDAPTDSRVIHTGGKRLLLGDSSGTQKTLMADNFLSALDALHDALNTAITSLPGGSGVALALGAAITAFKLAATRDEYKTATVEVK